MSGKEFIFNDRTGELDDVFLFENILVVVEYTVLKSSSISGHLLKKKVLFDHILNEQSSFVAFFEENFPRFSELQNDIYSSDQYRVVIVYASKNPIAAEHKKQLPRVKFLDYPILKYFGSVTKAVKESAKFELLAFFDLDRSEIGEAILKGTENFLRYKGTVLPENHSNFPKGYKIVSFYIDPEALLSNAYVLRRQGWRDELDLYQRMILPKKINAIRRYLNENDRVFVNNIIVTLPKQTRLTNTSGDTIDPSELAKIKPVTIEIPDEFNAIGLIDGQHRVFAYHEGGDFDEKIGKLRKVQNLLATGIIYPTALSKNERRKFESKLFLEINSTQANASSELKQEIGLMLRPFSPESIAKALINKLNRKGPLENEFEVRFYETDKIKTTSIVSYGLKPLVKLSGNDSLYSLWEETKKADLLKESDTSLLDRYLTYCATELNTFLGAVRAKASASQWTTDRKEKNRILSTTSLNGLIICFRKLIEEGKTGTSAYYQTKLSKLSSYDFSRFKSSQYKAMAEDIYKKYFK